MGSPYHMHRDVCQCGKVCSSSTSIVCYTLWDVKKSYIFAI